MRRHYTLPKRDPVPPDTEPPLLSHDVIADELWRMNRPRMSDYVRHIGKENVRLYDQVRDLIARLETYEPTPKHEHYGPRRTGD